jgi:hypothetical protein
MRKKTRCPKCKPLQTKRFGTRWVGTKRRFTKFTDCKIGMNKLKNGKAPLELAGVKVEGVDYLNL